MLPTRARIRSLMVMKYSLYLAGALLCSCTSIKAQDLPTNSIQGQKSSATDGPSPEDLQELAAALRLVQTTNLWNKTFDWTERAISTQEAIADIKKKLGPDAPAIEVRGQDDNNSTFVLQSAPLGSVLCSLAELADYRVWVFPGRLLLCAENDLTDQERGALASKSVGRWTQSSSWDASNKLNQISVKIVGAEIKGQLAAKGQTAPISAPTTPRKLGERTSSYELPFKDLSATSQKALQDLVNTSRYNFDGPLTIAPTTLVCLDDSRERIESLFFKEPGVTKPLLKYFEWSMIRPRSTPSP